MQGCDAGAEKLPLARGMEFRGKFTFRRAAGCRSKALIRAAR